MNLDEIIRRTLKKMADDHEIRRSMYLSTIHKSIDALLQGAPSWFGENVPEEFRGAIRHLMQISASYGEQVRDFNSFIPDGVREAVELGPLLESVAESLSPLSLKVSVDHSDGENGSVVQVPVTLFRDALTNLLICVLQFSVPETEVSLHSKKTLSTVSITVKAENLSSETPDLSHLTKPVLAEFNGSSYTFRIGFELPLNDLRKIGAVVDLNSVDGGRKITVIISLPSSDFLHTVEDIRAVAAEQLERSEGVIVLSLDDPILSLVLREKLGERGYTVTSCPAEKIRYLSGSSYKAMIVDSGKISGGLIGEFDLQDADGRGRVIVICGESENAVFPGPAFRQLSMPFEIDQVIGHIEA